MEGATDAAAEDLRRRNRLKQKRLRERVAGERRQLRAQVASLVKTLAVAQSKPKETCLSWKSIAASLARSSVESKLTLTMLRQEIERAWVASMHPSRSLLPNAPFNWTDITLMAEPASRRLGLDWYTKHLYHNTDRMQQLCAFPSSGTVVDNLVVNIGNDLVDLIGRIQIDYDKPLEATYDVLRDKIWAELRGDTHSFVSEYLDEELVKSIDPKMLYRRTVLDVEESNYYVCREFNEPNRVVFLFGNFTQDALQPRNLEWRPRLFWYILERLGPNKTRLKAMMYNGPKMVRGRLVTWKDVLGGTDEDFTGRTESQQFDRYVELVNEQFDQLLRVDYASLALKALETERSKVENMEREARLRLRNRLKQKRHRDRCNAERDTLLEQVAQLSRELHRAAKRPKSAPSTLLSWQAIADALAEEANDAKTAQRVLTAQHKRLMALGRAMGLWVSAVSRRDNLPAIAEPWSSVALVAEPTARSLGLDWFTRHLYHNTERMVQLSAFPSEGIVKDTLIRDCGDGISDLVGRIQIEYDLPLTAVHTLLAGRIWNEMLGAASSSTSDYLDADLTAKIDPKLIYLRSALSANESNFFAAREFATDDRIVFAVGNFTQDALQPVNTQWRPRMFWYVLESLGLQRTRLRAVLYNGPKIRNGNVVTWQQDTGLMNVQSAPDGLSFTEFQRIVRRHVQPIVDVDYATLSLESLANGAEDARTAHQRLRNRLKQKRHRDRYTSERRHLINRINELQGAVDALQKKHRVPTSLSWQYVAGGLAQARVESCLTLEVLRAQYEEMDALTRSMTAWVAAASTRTLVPARLQILESNQVELAAELGSRKLGLDWFTQHLYCNAERMLTAAEFPSEETFHDISVLGSPHDELLYVLGRIQIMYNSSFRDAYAGLRQKIWRKIRGDTYPWVSQYLDEEMVRSIDNNMVYRRSPMTAAESNYYVSREFVSDSRAVFVLGNFTQDALQPVNEQWRPRFFWFIVEPAGDSLTRLRWLSFTGPNIAHGKALGWQDDLVSLGAAEQHRARLRLRYRLKHKRHRDRFTTERDALRRQIEELAAVLAQARTQGSMSTPLLAWRDIAMGLVTATASARLTNELLREANEATYSLASTMASWVAIHSRNLITTVMPPGFTPTVLLADPAARKLGLDWYTQHLYHNTERMLQLCAFPATGPVQDVTVIDHQDSGLSDAFGRVQIEYNESLEDTYAALADKIWSVLRGDTHQSISEFLDCETTRQIDPKLVYRRTPRGVDESNYYACREFRFKDRVVFLYGNFSHDALQPVNIQWKARMFWLLMAKPYRGAPILFQPKSLLLTCRWSVNTLHSLLTADEARRVAHQRQRNRMKQKRHRERFNSERARLRAQIAELGAVVATLQKTGEPLLPWKEVAAGLAQASVESRLSLEAVRYKCEAMARHIRCMSAWVAAMTRPPMYSSCQHLLGPAPTMLLADRDARRQGLDWFTQHLYHNTDRMLHESGLHNASGSLQDMLVVNRGNGLADILGRIQVDNPLSLEDTVAALQDKLWAELRGDTHPCGAEILDEELVRSIDPKMVYRRTALNPEESNYYVCRQFSTENRVVFLFGNFNQDALQPVNLVWRPRYFWYVLERRGARQTRIKAMFYNGPKVVHGRVLTWKDEIKQDGVDLGAGPDDAQFWQYQQHIDEDWRPLMDCDYKLLTLQPLPARRC
ncbi:hypothetical protein ACHHYP_12286 [Achlya hypogyna]|uniref:BZIP domain-containing protein n=1 Tax=Achlya hypogyna TaxID=1202772 RepID=A0A1V9YH86_ACHHY|nr:hypothetical protein ACHHYP_12286 [Achlya hypogyna]